MDAIFERASVHAFTPDPVSDEQAERLLRAAMAAPSACNQQPWEFYVVRDPQLLARLGKATPYARPTAEAPCCIVACYRSDIPCLPFVQQDLGAATENILIEAVGLGLGCCWQGVAPEEERMEAVRQVVGAPQEICPFCLIAVGVPSPGAARPRGSERYNPDRVHWLG